MKPSTIKVYFRVLPQLSSGQKCGLFPRAQPWEGVGGLGGGNPLPPHFGVRFYKSIHLILENSTHPWENSVYVPDYLKQKEAPLISRCIDCTGHLTCLNEAAEKASRKIAFIMVKVRKPHTIHEELIKTHSERNEMVLEEQQTNDTVKSSVMTAFLDNEVVIETISLRFIGQKTLVNKVLLKF